MSAYTRKIKFVDLYQLHFALTSRSTSGPEIGTEPSVGESNSQVAVIYLFP